MNDQLLHLDPVYPDPISPAEREQLNIERAYQRAVDRSMGIEYKIHNARMARKLRRCKNHKIHSDPMCEEIGIFPIVRCGCELCRDL